MTITKSVTLLGLTSLLLGIVLGVAKVDTAWANQDHEVSQEQELNQEFEADCEFGQYGQGTCRIEGEQYGKQKQKVVIVDHQEREKVAGVYHEPVDTSLDFSSQAMAAISAMGGVGAFVVKRKISN